MMDEELNIATTSEATEVLNKLFAVIDNLDDGKWVCVTGAVHASFTIRRSMAGTIQKTYVSISGGTCAPLDPVSVQYVDLYRASFFNTGVPVTMTLVRSIYEQPIATMLHLLSASDKWVVVTAANVVLDCPYFVKADKEDNHVV